MILSPGMESVSILNFMHIWDMFHPAAFYGISVEKIHILVNQKCKSLLKILSGELCENSELFYVY